MTPQTVERRPPRRLDLPAFPPRPLTAAPDEASHALGRAAKGVLQRVPHIIGACSAASHGPIESREPFEVYRALGRAWRFTSDRRELRCILDERSERILLGWIVGAPPARGLSPIERSIVAEAVKQLLAATPDAVAEEVDPHACGQALEQAWCCEIELGAAGAERAALRLVTAVAPQPASVTGQRPDVGGVALSLRAMIAGIACPLGEIARWQSGSLLRLHRPESDLGVSLYAGARHLATAQLGAIGDRRALRLVSVGTGGRL